MKRQISLKNQKTFVANRRIGLSSRVSVNEDRLQFGDQTFNIRILQSSNLSFDRNKRLCRTDPCASALFSLAPTFVRDTASPLIMSSICDPCADKA